MHCSARVICWILAGLGAVLRRSGGWLIRVFREPLAHFLSIGLAVFIASGHVASNSNSAKIEITQDHIRRLTDNYHLQYGVYPTSDKVEALINQFIREEMFYREAVNLGLDHNDEIVRRRLVQKYAFLQEDLAIPAEPAETKLLEYYREHEDLYFQPETITFNHVYFSLDGKNERKVRQRAEETAGELNRQKLAEATALGDQFPGSYSFVSVSREDVVREFGSEELADAVFNIKERQWSEPLRSGLGWHIVYLISRKDRSRIAFDEVKGQVRREYIERERERRNAIFVRNLQQRFEIVRQ